MKLRPSRYKPINWIPQRQYSPTGALIGLWTIALSLGLYFSEDIILADNGESKPYSVFVSVLGNHLKSVSKTVHLFQAQKQLSSAIHGFYDQHHTVGDRRRAKPWQDNESLGESPADTDAIPEICEDDQPLPPKLPKRVLLLGSSSMYSSMGVSLQKQLTSIDGLDVMRHAKPGTGLSRPDVYNWLEVSTDLSKKHKADLVVAQFIGNDCQNLITLDKTVEARRQDSHWNDSYRKRVADFIDAHQKLGAEVVLIGMPIVRSPKFQKSLLNANQIVKSIAAEKGAHYISTWEITADSSGRYTEALRLSNKTIKLRHDDGIHLSYKGAQFMAEYLTEQLSELYPWEEEPSEMTPIQPSTADSTLTPSSQTADANDATMDTAEFRTTEVIPSD